VLDDDPDRTRVPLAGGVFVYEERDLGRELVGVENVEDWDALATAGSRPRRGVPPGGARRQTDDGPPCWGQ
jgi:hypothetical protein